MKQFEQVIEVMRNNGGFATLGFLNHNVDVSLWATKTPFASIRGIVQDEKYFFKIRPGLWALKEYKDEILTKFEIQQSPEKEKDFSHSYYQGLLIELGNMENFQTFIPAQDKNKLFLNQKLGSVSSLEKIYDFSYENIVKRARTIDVIWFNERNLPYSFFEVEHTTDIQNSLLKFNDLQDFYSKYYIISAEARRNEFEQKISNSAFKMIKDRVEFRNYESVSKLHSKSFELSQLRKL